MVPQEELNARMGVRTNPGTDGGGIVQNILKTAFPGFFLFSGVKQGFEAVEYGRFNTVANAANFPLAALVSGREAGNAQGGRPVTRSSSKRRMAAAIFFSVVFIGSNNGGGSADLQ